MQVTQMSCLEFDLCLWKSPIQMKDRALGRGGGLERDVKGCTSTQERQKETMTNGGNSL